VCVMWRLSEPPDAGHILSGEDAKRAETSCRRQAMRRRDREAEGGESQCTEKRKGKRYQMKRDCLLIAFDASTWLPVQARQ